MSMNQDPFSGTGKNFSGQVEEGFGRVTGDVKTEVEGKMKQAAGAAQDLYGQAKEAAGDVARSVQEQAAPPEEFLRNTIETRPYTAVHRPHGRPCGLLTPLDPRRSSETVGGSAHAVPDCLHLFTSNLRSGVGPSGAVAPSKAPIFGDGRSTSAGADDPGPAAPRRRSMAIGLRIAPRGDRAVCASTDSQRASGAADLVRLDGIIMTNGAPVTVIMPAGTLRCSMAEAIARWVRTDLGAALAELGSVPVAITNEGSYNCRGRNNDASAKISEHGRGNAFDLGPVKLADGAVIDLSNRFTPQSFRQRLRDAACNRFSTVLGPGSDPYHANHIHLDLAERARGYSANGMSKSL